MKSLTLREVRPPTGRPSSAEENKMKLAEALNARKELEARLTRLEERLHASARVQ
jgi:hypothetical protein